MTIQEYRRSVERALRDCEYRQCDSKELRDDIVRRLTYIGDSIQLYQYRACNENTINGLRHGAIMFKSPIEFNDPFDSLLCWNEAIVQKYFDKAEFKKVLNDFWMFKPSDVARRLSHVFKISCFSEVPDSPLMWAHYAQGGKGFCVEYELMPTYGEVMCLKDGDQCLEGRFSGCKKDACKFCCEFSLFPVLYSKERPDATSALCREIEYMVAHRLGKSNQLDLDHYDKLEPYKITLFKSVDWAYEKEWRIVLSGIGEELTGNRLYPSDKVVRVILGANMSPRDEFNVSKSAEAYAKRFKRRVVLAKAEVDWDSKDYALTVTHLYTIFGDR